VDDVLAVAQWPPQGKIPREVLIVDLAGASDSVWEHLARLSRVSPRPSIILIDDAAAPRQHLARVAADALLSRDVHLGGVADVVDTHRSQYVFRCAAEALKNSASMPFPLSRFLASAILEPAPRVSTLARSLSMKESTLRSQWRKWRTDPTIRLEDVVRRLAQLHRDARVDCNGWRMQLQELARVIVGASD
jgi:hypothetical protein